MDKRTIIAQLDIDISNAESALKRLQSLSKEGLLGKKGAKDSDAQLQGLLQKLAQLKAKAPGIGAGEAEFKQFSSAIKKTATEVQKCLSKMTGFEITDDYIKQNVAEVKQFVTQLKEAESRLSALQKGVKGTKLSTYQTEGEKRASQQAESEMRKQAAAGETKKVEKAYSARAKVLKEKIAAEDPNSERYKKLTQDLNTLTAAYQRYSTESKKVAAATVTQSNAADQLAKSLEKPRREMQQTQETINKEGREITDSFNRMENGVYGVTQEFDRLRQSGKSIGQLGDRIAYLFSATSVFYLMRRVIREVIQDFKELDKQFNEIAIVSDKSTQEMWDQFSSVNEMAQKFGVTTTNVLEVQNLYYHQGKETAEVNKLTAQTLTLAKITGMDYARATSDLTAALNAYNLKAEEAVRVTDTIAAMDTNAAISSEELMTALTKTASIAANAGMSLESTEIFLTKMIETTREAPENLGTALKTIIARFGEVKEEIDGEAIELADINRVDTALKTVGITLLDTTGQIRDLDQVFLELSSKWDDLDRNTQRYIATIAAGSRQQSRFIAMMEDYDRTLELTEAMNNSAGIGARQLAKSMESIETSLNTLTSSWQEFTQKFMTNKMFTGFLNTVNELLGVLNDLPAPILAIGIAVGAWALKTKVLDRALIAHKVIQQSVMEGDTAEVTALKLQTAMRRKSEGSLRKYAAILKVYNHQEKQSFAIATAKAATFYQEKIALSDLNKETLEGILIAGGLINAEDKLSDEAWEAMQAFFTKGEAIEELTEEYGNLAVAMAAYQVLLKSENNELDKNLVLSYLKTGSVGDKKQKRKVGIAGGISSFGTRLQEGSKEGSMTNKIGAFLTKNSALLGKILIVLLAIAAAVALTYGVWKKFFAASRDDTKKVEALAKAQENYNNALQKYRGLRDKINKLEKLQTSQYTTTEDRQEQQNIIQEIIEEYPTLLDYIDEEGNYHLKNADAIQREIDNQKELASQTQATYNSLHAQQSMRGIYSDESTAAGQNMSQLQDYFASFDKEGLKSLAKSIDRFGLGFSQDQFVKLAEAYGKGEKFSFNHKDFNNLFAGFNLGSQSFNEMTKAYKDYIDQGRSQEDAIKQALIDSGAYTENDSDTLNKIAQAWSALNVNTGNIYSDLLSNASLEIGDIYLKEGKVFIENELQDSNVSEEVKEVLAELYAKNKEEITKELTAAKIEERTAPLLDVIEYSPTEEVSKAETFGEKITAVLGEFGRWLGGQSSASSPAWAAVGVEVEKKAVENGKYDAEIENEAKTQAEAEYKANLEKLKDPKIAKAMNEQYTEFMDKIATDKVPEFDFSDTVLKGFEIVFKEIEEMRQDEISKFKAELRDQTVFQNNNFSYGEYDAIISKYDTYGEVIGQSFAEGLAEIKKLEDEFLKDEYLSLNFSNLSEVSVYLDKARASAKDTNVVIGDLEQDILNVANAAGAIHFGDVIAEVEKLTSRFEDLEKSMEGLMKLSRGEGDLTAVANYISNLADAAKDFDEFNTNTKTLLENIKITGEGIQLGTAANSAKSFMEMQQKQIILELELLQGQYNKAYREGNKDEMQRLLSDMYLYRIAYGEAKATYLRQEKENNIKSAEKTLENYQKTRDTLKDLVTWLKEYDRFLNLDRSIESLTNEQKHLEFEIDFSTNTKVIEQDIVKTMNNLNRQVAANQGGLAAARDEQAMWKNVLQKDFSYVSFGANGEAILNAEKMQKLQESMVDASEEQKEIIQNQYDQIMSNVDAYEKARKKVNDYTTALENNFKALEDFLKKTYENVTKVEDKLIQVRIAKEDKELEAVKEKYEAIKEEDNKYLQSVREMVDKERGIRDRKTQEEDVKIKEKRLAMMKMDSSGIYARDIQALEAELQDDYQSLEDAAVDDAIDEMEQKYNAQAELYDKDIEFMENSLAYKREKMTEYNTWATQLIQQGSDAVLAYLKANDEEYYTGTAAAQQLWEIEWNNSVAKAISSNEVLKKSLFETVKAALETCKSAAKGFEEGVKDYSETAVIENGKVKTSVSSLITYYSNLATGVSGVRRQIDLLAAAYNSAASAALSLSKAQSEVIGVNPYTSEVKGREPEDKDDKEIITEMQYTKHTNAAGDVGEQVGEVTAGYTNKRYEMVASIKDDKENEYAVFSDPSSGSYFAVYMDNKTDDGNDNFASTRGFLNSISDKTGTPKEGEYYYIATAAQWYGVDATEVTKLKGYATGGLADFTGPAWLDGTRTRPEMVLNPLQTQHFIQLVNVLDSIFSKPLISSPRENTNNSSSKGDTYHFNIEVSQMANDYDVDKLIKRIEEKMTKASQYRSVTVVKKTN